MTTSSHFDWQVLETFCTRLFTRAGVPRHRARIIAESLVQADLRGVGSHGVVRVPIYLERLEQGMVDPTADVEVVSDHGAMALIDGQNNFGAVVGTEALHLALSRTADTGISLVGVKGSNHFGTCAYYALQAIEADHVLLVMSNASQTMPPTGGIRPFIGTNPLAVGVPTQQEVPFLLDMATSVVARGKIITAAQKGERIPEGWAVDPNGNPTTDAEAALEGSVLPFGGPKGYGLSMCIDILSGVLTGAGFGRYVHNMYENWNDPQNVGHFFLSIDVKQFMPVNRFKQRMDQYIQEIKAEPKQEGVDEILIPGELEHRTTQQRKAKGIELPSALIHELKELGWRYGLQLRTRFREEEIM